MERLLLCCLPLPFNDVCRLCGVRMHSFHLFFDCSIAKQFSSTPVLTIDVLSMLKFWTIWKAYCSVLWDSHVPSDDYFSSIAWFVFKYQELFPHHSNIHRDYVRKFRGYS